MQNDRIKCKMKNIFFQMKQENNFVQSDKTLIEKHLKTITKTNEYRNFKNIATLNQTADYILSVFKQYADTAYFQPYKFENEMYKNVICRLGSNNDKPLVVVGAHYDVCGDQEGADDNASGVVGLLELVRILSKEKLNFPVEIVAYNTEELYLCTKNAGSYIHAKSLFDAKISVYGMVCFEMIGYFDDNPKSQLYPIKLLKNFYGSKGNYILLASKTNAGNFVKNFSNGFKKSAKIKTKKFKAPPSLVRKSGIGRSDHYNYWKFDYDALMITDTAEYRNPNYHKNSDVMETLDIPKMMGVIEATASAIIGLK